MPHASSSFFVMIDIGGDNSNSPVDHHHRANPNLGEVGNQHHLRSLMLGRNRAQQKKMHDDEKPRDYCREVAAERIEIGQACQSANAERRKKLMGGVLLGAMLLKLIGISALLFIISNFQLTLPAPLARLTPGRSLARPAPPRARSKDIGIKRSPGSMSHPHQDFSKCHMTRMHGPYLFAWKPVTVLPLLHVCNVVCSFPP